MDRLAVFKALGDDTRFALYRELTASPAALSTSELAERLHLHPNTVRPHLERLREAGLLEVESDSRGTVGRPQHRYSPAPGAPGVGLEPPAYQLLAGLLAQVAVESGSDADTAARVGRAEGRRMAQGAHRPMTCAEVVRAAMSLLGFEPALEQHRARGGQAASASLAFARCPFRELAEAYPDVVCHLHRGIVEGVTELFGGAEVAEFATLSDNRPCRAELALR